jgi:hypothetical protein
MRQKRTEIDKVAPEDILELGRVKGEGTDVQGEVVLVDGDGDGGCPVAVADVSTVHVGKVGSNVLEPLLDFGVLPLHLIQLVHLLLQRPLVPLGLGRVRQTLHLGRQTDDLVEVRADQVAAVGKKLLEASHSTDANLFGSLASAWAGMLIVGLRILVEDVLAGDSHDLAAGVAVSVLVDVEVKAETALSILGLSILGLSLLGGDRQPKSSSERTTDSVGGVGLVHDAHQRSQLLNRSFVPLDHHTLHSILLEDAEDGGRDVTALLGSGGAGMSGDPESDGGEGLLLLVVVGGEANTLEGRVADAIFLEELDNRRDDGVPDGVQGLVENTLSRLDGELEIPGSPRGRKDVGIRLEICAPDEMRGVVGDPVPEVNSFELGDKVRGGDLVPFRGGEVVFEDHMGVAHGRGGRANSVEGLEGATLEHVEGNT